MSWGPSTVFWDLIIVVYINIHIYTYIYIYIIYIADIGVILNN